MRYEVSADVESSMEQAWAVLSDVAAMPTWTPTMKTVVPAGALAVGVKVRITQPKLRPSDWVVTELTPGTSFSWLSKAGGVTTEAAHVLSTDGSGVRLTLSIEQSGLLVPLFARTTRSYVDTELAGFVARVRS